jgi:NADP-dependent 3-hydroxy acid dehydrogenase YdfG
MNNELCVITGVGPGTGTALVRKFAERYRVVMIARNAQRLQALADEIPGSIPLVCDVADATALQLTLSNIAALGKFAYQCRAGARTHTGDNTEFIVHV